jgi:peptidoglycan/LPS O-acetylase OafA/YrhL
VSRRRANGLLLTLVLVFLLINQLYDYAAARYASTVWYKLIGVSFLPWFYMFLVGVLYQIKFDAIRVWLGGRFLTVFVSYLIVALIGRDLLGWAVGNALSPPLFVALTAVIFAAAFSRSTLSDALLRRNDVSYGMYIYHMPVVNFVLAMGLGGSAASLSIAIVATLALSYLSWRWVEKPALSLKKHPLYQHSAARA